MPNSRSNSPAPEGLPSGGHGVSVGDASMVTETHKLDHHAPLDESATPSRIAVRGDVPGTTPPAATATDDHFAVNNGMYATALLSERHAADRKTTTGPQPQNLRACQSGHASNSNSPAPEGLPSGGHGMPVDDASTVTETHKLDRQAPRDEPLELTQPSPQARSATVRLPLSRAVDAKRERGCRSGEDLPNKQPRREGRVSSVDGQFVDEVNREPDQRALDANRAINDAQLPEDDMALRDEITTNLIDADSERSQALGRVDASVRVSDDELDAVVLLYLLDELKHGDTVYPFEGYGYEKARPKINSYFAETNSAFASVTVNRVRLSLKRKRLDIDFISDEELDAAVSKYLCDELKHNGIVFKGCSKEIHLKIKAYFAARYPTLAPHVAKHRIRSSLQSTLSDRYVSNVELDAAVLKYLQGKLQHNRIKYEFDGCSEKKASPILRNYFAAKRPGLRLTCHRTASSLMRVHTSHGVSNDELDAAVVQYLRGKLKHNGTKYNFKGRGGPAVHPILKAYFVAKNRDPTRVTEVRVFDSLEKARSERGHVSNSELARRPVAMVRLGRGSPN